jgi:acyl carrier protein
VYIGRKDTQIKLRGFRIELEEIESVLLKYDDITNVALNIQCIETESKPSENKFLVAYYVSNIEISTDNLIKFLSDRLPHYMVVKHYVRLKSIPISINGKVNRVALPKIAITDSQRKYSAPITEQQKAICALWAENLGVEKVGIEDSFFALGGSSLLAIKLAFQMSKVVGYKINVAQIFEFNTIDELLKNTKAPEEKVIRRGEL